MTVAAITQIAYAVQTLFDPAGTVGRLVDLGKLANYGLLGTEWSPAFLFLAGEQGVWYDPSDLTTLYQDAAGTTPVTAVEQPVGLMMDKSGRGNHAFQTVSTKRPVLSARVNQYLATETLATQNVTTLATGYTLRFSGAGTITLSGTATGVYSAGTHAITCTAGTLTSTVSGTVTQADLRPANTGVNLPAYQKVNTATDYDTQGFPLSVRFDGIDDALQTNSIDFTATDKMTVFAGVRKLSDATIGILVELGPLTTQTGGFSIANGYLGPNVWNFDSKGTVSVDVRPARTAPITDVLTLQSSITSPTILSTRINGAASGSNTNSQGSGSFNNLPIYIGARAGPSLFFNGNLYNLIVRGAQSTDLQIADTEQWVNGKTAAF